MSAIAASALTLCGAAEGREAAAPRHLPVMAHEIGEELVLRPGGVFVDATINGGGHAARFLTALPQDNAYLGLDLDPAALERASRRLGEFNSRVILTRCSFARLAEAVGPFAGRVTNVLFDLGLSSDQLGDESRGFSFKTSGPLNMRFDGEASGLTAAAVVNTFAEDELADVIYEFGEERRSRAIARAIVARRADKPFDDAADLAEVVARTARGRRGRIHPATRTFQALRIFVNDELNALTRALPQAVDVLASGGRLFVISYHSLEDRIVKHFYRQAEESGKVRILTAKPMRPTAEEVRANPRSRSARLRIAEKV